MNVVPRAGQRAGRASRSGAVLAAGQVGAAHVVAVLAAELDELFAVCWPLAALARSLAAARVRTWVETLAVVTVVVTVVDVVGGSRPVGAVHGRRGRHGAAWTGHAGCGWRGGAGTGRVGSGVGADTGLPRWVPWPPPGVVPLRCRGCPPPEPGSRIAAGPVMTGGRKCGVPPPVCHEQGPVPSTMIGKLLLPSTSTPPLVPGVPSVPEPSEPVPLRILRSRTRRSRSCRWAES